MGWNSRSTILVLAIATLALIGLGWWSGGDLSGLWTDRRGAEPAPLGADGSANPGSLSGRVPLPDAAAPATPARSTLTLQVRNTDGSPVAGIVSWSNSTDPSVSARSMPMFAGTIQNGVRQESFAGTASLEVASSEWTWLKVVRQANPVRSWFLRIEPFAGPRVEELVLDDDARALHVFVWNAQIRGPAALREVSIYAADTRTGAPPAIHKKLTTDQHGYAVARGLPPGRFFIAGPGSGLRDRHPRCAQVILPEGMPFAEATCVVVATPEGAPVQVKVLAKLEGGRNSAVAPKLFLARVDDGSRTCYPLQGTVVDGTTEMAVEVPPGTYEPGVLPIGALVLKRAERFLRVEAGQENLLTIHATRDPASTRLSIEGIAREHFPITVHPRRCEDAVLAEDDRLLFLGHYRWKSGSHFVPGLPFPCQLVVSGRGGTFLSKPGVDVSSSEVVVPVVPASRIQVRWFGSRSAACAEAVVAATPEGEADALVSRMRRELVRRGADLVPAMVVSIVVPLGDVSLECRSADGTVAWVRKHAGNQGLTSVDVLDN